MSANDKVSSRTGKKFIGGYFNMEVAKRIKTLAAEEETTIQDLVGEAIDGLFKKRGLHGVRKARAVAAE